LLIQLLVQRFDRDVKIQMPYPEIKSKLTTNYNAKNCKNTLKPLPALHFIELNYGQPQQKRGRKKSPPGTTCTVRDQKLAGSSAITIIASFDRAFNFFKVFKSQPIPGFGLRALQP
jgi:hypothetical protein